MRLEQAFTLPLPPAQAWLAFKHVDLLVECLPGASLTGPAVEGELPLRFDVKLGPIAAGFTGSGRVTFDDAAQSGRFEGQAADRRTSSRVKGAAAFGLSPAGTGTRVQVAIDYALTGSLAQFSRGAIVRELASALTSQFAANLAARFGEMTTAAAEEAPAPAHRPPVRAAASRPLAPLSAWSLLKAALAARWQRLWHRPHDPHSP